MGRKVLIVAEKPHAAKLIQAAWLRVHPMDEVSFFLVPPMGVLDLDIPCPEGLPQAPVLAEPRFTPGKWMAAFEADRVVLNTDFGAAERGCDLLVCATDPDRQGCRNFMELCDFYGVDLAAREAVRLHLDVYTEKAFDEAIRNPRGFEDAGFVQARALGDASRYVTWLYEINARPILTRLLAETGLKTKYRWLSKYQLQLLLGLIDMDYPPLTQEDLIRVLSNAFGTGQRYRGGMGSAMSRYEIFLGLKKAGMLVSVGRTRKNEEAFAPSDLARELAGKLVPLMRDIDLPRRVEGWGRTWPASRGEIDRHMSACFGAQLAAMAAERESAAI